MLMVHDSKDPVERRKYMWRTRCSAILRTAHINSDYIGLMST